MDLPASKSLKVVYVLTILAAILPVGLASSSWVKLATGGSIAGSLPFIGALVLLILGVYRIALVVKTPETLDARPVSGIALVLRKIGIFALYIGAIVAVLNLAARPLITAFVTHRSESGVEFFVVGLYLSLLSGFGFSGLLMFEFSRLLGFERYANGE